ncbi:SusC/RagA family TonB-linked outer membrane protein [Pseudoflavitalea sp. G-6-1-2]|uniref:SusC/RagA family TonB-linked outer membrane protein n=1 Tax=Pseudoflavitalea sp. G-6-1-2 TaxID=2728841 RepID=UPI00146F0503|nr:SusC/RagA family TonB-linked outer membrane protein [Pseudoflavitalea sp. G-6-1-2]NML21685.1 SusC/RagA family TonB-linked outer membrane protein [Pseudoflavitalea sp. G-6-1-2]
MRTIASLMTVFLLSVTVAFGQAKKVSGQVKDEKGDPVPFASVKVKGKPTGVSADATGYFTIEIGEAEATLLVSSQGFTAKEYPVSGTKFLELALTRNPNELQEVVVNSALGIKRSKNKLPYAAQVVAGEDLSRSRSSNFLSNLSGRAAGLEIRQSNTLGGSTNVVLRGNKTVTGNNQALFVVDGVPYDNTSLASGGQRNGTGGYDYGNAAADINPDDIESVTILKGPAASALYGSRGFNGVVMITTKKPTRGLGITVNSSITGVSIDKSTFPKYQNEYGAGYGAGYYEDPSGYFFYRDVNGDGIKDLVTPTSEDASFGAAFNKDLMVYQWDAFDPASPNYKKAKPWLAAKNGPIAFFESPVNFNNSVFLEGGSDKGTFKMGYTRNDDKGILPNSKITKDLVNFGATYNVTDKLTASFNLNYNKVNGRGRYGTGYSQADNQVTNFRTYWQTNVDLLELKDAYFRNRKNITWNWADPNDLRAIYVNNPYFAVYENYEVDSRNRYFGNASLNYKITDWLNVMGRISTDTYDEIQEERRAIGSSGVANYRRNNRFRREMNYDLMLSFDKNITNDINIKALAGTNIRTEKFSSIFAQTNGGLVVPRLYTLNNSKNNPVPPTETYWERETDGYFASATVGYQDFLTLDATIRRDASSTLPPGHNVYYYPSVSTGFIFSNLMKSVNWLSYGKLRAGYAEVGNDAPVYSVNNTYTSVASFGGQTLFSVSGTSNNLNLRLERNKSYEAGLEMSFLKSRVGFDVTYYNARSFDQVIPVTISRATGYDAVFLNSGIVDNKGIELSMFGTPVKTSNFSWNIALNWSQNRNKVVTLYRDPSGNEIENHTLGNMQQATINVALGQPYGVIKGKDYVYYGDPEGLKRDPAMRMVDASGRYLQTESSNHIIGNANPNWIGGISNSFRYQNFSFSFLIDIRQGGDVYSLDQAYGMSSGLYPETAGLNDQGKPVRNTLAEGGGFIRPGVTADGKPNTKRVSALNSNAFGYNAAPTAAFVYDASYVKLREVSFSYSMPKSIVAKLKPFKALDFALVGRNLWIMHKNLPYSDPEENYGAGNIQGYQGNGYPAQRTITFNVKMKF